MNSVVNEIISILRESYPGLGVDEVSNNKFLADCKLVRECRDEVIKEKTRKIMRNKFKAKTISASMTKLRELEEQSELEVKTAEANKNGTLYFFITINPKKSIILKDFRERLDKYVKRKMFKKYMYVIEQRGETEKEAGKGFHAHILVERNITYKPSKVISNSKNTWKTMTNVENKEIFNIQFIPQDYIEDKKTYMSIGGKTGEGKDVKQEIDKFFRKKENIEDFYVSEEGF